MSFLFDSGCSSDDVLEDDAHDVWVECFGSGGAEGEEENRRWR